MSEQTTDALISMQLRDLIGLMGSLMHGSEIWEGGAHHDKRVRTLVLASPSRPSVKRKLITRLGPCLSKRANLLRNDPTQT